MGRMCKNTFTKNSKNVESHFLQKKILNLANTSKHCLLLLRSCPTNPQKNSPPFGWDTIQCHPPCEAGLAFVQGCFRSVPNMLAMKKTPTQIRTGPQDVQMPEGLTWVRNTEERNFNEHFFKSQLSTYSYWFHIFQHFQSQCRDLKNVETSPFHSKIRANVSCTSPSVCPAMNHAFLAKKIMEYHGKNKIDISTRLAPQSIPVVPMPRTSEVSKEKLDANFHGSREG